MEHAIYYEPLEPNDFVAWSPEATISVWANKHMGETKPYEEFWKTITLHPNQPRKFANTRVEWRFTYRRKHYLLTRTENGDAIWKA